MIEFKKTKIPFFRRFVLQNFPFIEKDFDALTDYELICKVIEYLNKVIDSTNEMSEQVEILTDSYNTLKDYVDHYFENLDVQEEINNKLDQMAQDGTLQEIINAYINSNATLGFNTLSDMKTSQYLVDGSYCHILGRESLNDGGENFYKVRTKTESDVIDNVKIVQLYNENLVAELIIKDEYLNITPIYKRFAIDSTYGVGTDVWYCIIPNDYKPELFLANDAINNVEYANRTAYRNKVTLMTNAGVFNVDTDATVGLVINHGETLKTNNDLSADHSIIYMLADGIMNCVPGTTPTANVEALQPEWAVTAMSPIVQNGVEVEHSTTDFKPRTFIGQDANGNYIIGVAAGRKYNEQGLTQPLIKTFVESVGFTPYFLFNLDGGGSSQMLSCGRRVSSQDYFNSRPCANYIGWRRKDVSDNSLFKSNYETDVLTDNLEWLKEPKNQLQRLTVHPDSDEVVTILGSANSSLRIVQQVAYLNIRIRTDAVSPAYRKLITGLPLPYATSNMSVMAMNLNDNSVYKLTLQPSSTTDSEGIAELAVGAYGGGLPAGAWFINLAYPFRDSDNKYNFPVSE